MMYHANKDVVRKDKRNTENKKGEENEDKLNKNLKKIKVEDCMAICSKMKPHNTVTKNKIMTKHKLDMMISKGDLLNNRCMQERELESHKLCLTEFKENLKKKSMKCIKESFSKIGKMKCYSLLQKITKPMLYNVKWVNSKMLYSPF